VVRIISLAGYSMPIFWVGMMGLLVFYAWLGWVGPKDRHRVARQADNAYHIIGDAIAPRRRQHAQRNTKTYSMPIFWVGMMGLLVFYAWLGWVGGAGRVELGLDPPG
jgi:ABC-type dipeptide/oligopeptide/nickel transport system permease component